jgi:hypothetical protein
VRNIFRFGVLQSQLSEFKVVLLDVVVSEVKYFKVLQDRVRSLLIYKSIAVEVIIVQSKQLWLEVHEFISQI